MEDIKQKTLTKEDIEKAFIEARVGSAKFIDTAMQQELDKFFKGELKVTLTEKQWTSILLIWQHFNTALFGLYRDKTLELLSLPEGEYLMVEMEDQAKEEPKKEKKEKKKKKKTPKKKSDPFVLKE